MSEEGIRTAREFSEAKVGGAPSISTAKRQLIETNSRYIKCYERTVSNHLDEFRSLPHGSYRGAQPYFDVKAIELASGQRKYKWWRGESDASVHTLTSGDWEDQNIFLVTVKLWQD